MRRLNFCVGKLWLHQALFNACNNKTNSMAYRPARAAESELTICLVHIRFVVDCAVGHVSAGVSVSTATFMVSSWFTSRVLKPRRGFSAHLTKTVSFKFVRWKKRRAWAKTLMPM